MTLLKSIITTTVLGFTLSCSPTGKATENSSAKEKVSPSKTMAGTIVRDCTGTYVRVNEKDYQVCNADLLKKYSENAKVSVNYIIAKECPEFDGTAVCMMYHPKEALIRVQSVK